MQVVVKRQRALFQSHRIVGWGSAARPPRPMHTLAVVLAMVYIWPHPVGSGACSGAGSRFIPLQSLMLIFKC